ncbi:MAG: hypothetical protein J7559_01830, partial [Cohnella sp.]|nr:hypothetical protein [Cohnella sp.]
ILRQGERTAGWIRLLATIIGVLTFHYALTSFFVGGSPSSESVSKFGIIWAGPFIIAIFIFALVQLINGAFSALSGMLYGMIGIAFAGPFLNKAPSELWILLLFLAAFLLSFFENFIRYTLYRFFLWLPVVFILTIIVMTIFPVLTPTSLIIKLSCLIAVCIVSFVFAYYIGNKNRAKSTRQLDKEQQTSQALRRKMGTTVTLLLVSLATFLLTCIPVVSSLTGSYFRLLNPNIDRQTISYGDNTVIENAILVAKKDGVYYISNSDWRLIVLRTEQIRVDE